MIFRLSKRAGACFVGDCRYGAGTFLRPRETAGIRRDAAGAGGGSHRLIPLYTLQLSVQIASK